MTERLRYFALTVSTGQTPTVRRHEFHCAVDAENGGTDLATTAAGVLVYQQHMDEEAGIYGDPDPLLVIGALPDALLNAECCA